MIGKRILAVLAVVAVAALAGSVYAGEAGGGGRGGRGGGPGGADYRQRMMDGIKSALVATDEEWKVLQPRIEKVSTLNRQLQGTGMMGMFRRNRGGDVAGGGEAPAPTTELEKKTQELEKLLENKDAKPEDIKTRLTALRDERAKAKEELEKAKKELRETLTLRQEAQLVLLNMLD